MFEVFTNSIVYPKNIVNYHNKKGGFVFLYTLALIILMSLATFVFYISNKPQEISELSSGCTIVDSSLVCSGETYDPNNKFELYDFTVYLLSEEDQLGDIINREILAIVLNGPDLTIFVGDRIIRLDNFMLNYQLDSLDEVIGVLEFSVISSGVFLGIISNTFILLFIIFVSTIPFMRFKKVISYRKIFKMLTFAATPMAFLFAIYNLVNFDMIIFFILMLVAYRSVLSLQRELQMRLIHHVNTKNTMEPQDIDSFEVQDDDNDENNDENNDEEE
jgi:hypothetical protein